MKSQFEILRSLKSVKYHFIIFTLSKILFISTDIIALKYNFNNISFHL